MGSYVRLIVEVASTNWSEIIATNWLITKLWAFLNNGFWTIWDLGIDAILAILNNLLNLFPS
jgi:hypothetical protein